MSYAHETSRAIARQLRKLVRRIEERSWQCFSADAPQSAFEHLNALHASLNSTLRLARRHARELRAQKT